jgi:hypothetical protein
VIILVSLGRVYQHRNDQLLVGDASNIGLRRHDLRQYRHADTRRRSTDRCAPRGRRHGQTRNSIFNLSTSTQLLDGPIGFSRSHSRPAQILAHILPVVPDDRLAESSQKEVYCVACLLPDTSRSPRLSSSATATNTE